MRLNTEVENGLYLLLVVNKILNNKGLGDGKVKFTSDLKKVKAGENNLSLEFSQVPTDTEKAMGSCMIKGEFTLYTDEKAKDFFWAVFKRLEGD